MLHTYSSFLKQLIGEAVVFILKMSERTSAPFGVWRLNVQRTWEQTISWCEKLRKILTWTCNLDIYHDHNYAQRIRGNFKFKVDLLIFIDFTDYPLIIINEFTSSTNCGTCTLLTKQSRRSAFPLFKPKYHDFLWWGQLKCLRRSDKWLYKYA